MAGIPENVTLHSTRKTAGTWALPYGDVKIVQDLLGHQNFKLTMDTYVSPMRSRQRKAVLGIERTFLKAQRRRAENRTELKIVGQDNSKECPAANELQTGEFSGDDRKVVVMRKPA